MTQSLHVDYVSHMGDDRMVVNSARVSFAKHVETLEPNDEKLLLYLAKHKHWTPFAHPQVQLRVTAPIFVARQLFKHKVGFTENEVSRRYVDFKPSVFLPTWRRKAKNVKQGSADTYSSPEQVQLLSIYKKSIEHALSAYDELLEIGVCPEQARAVLPQSMVTEWIWTGSLHALWRVYVQRSDPNAQQETQVIANQIYDILKQHFPRSIDALEKAHNE